MELKFALDTIIFYVQNVDRLKQFYTSTFNLQIIEEYQSVWALMDAGTCRIGLHKIGERYSGEKDRLSRFDNNTKIVFEIDSDINEARAHFIGLDIEMGEIKTFDGYDYWLCDGEDPEGNVFQLKRKKQL